MMLVCRSSLQYLRAFEMPSFFLEFSSSKVALDGVLQCTPGKIKNFISIASSIIKLLLKWPRRCEWRVRSAEKASV